MGNTGGKKRRPKKHAKRMNNNQEQGEHMEVEAEGGRDAKKKGDRRGTEHYFPYEKNGFGLWQTLYRLFPDSGKKGGIVANRRFSFADSPKKGIPPYKGLLPKSSDPSKLCVVLDMDETLIHSKFQSQRNMYRQEEKREDATRKADIHFSLSLNGGATKEKVAVYKRPGLDKFLEEASKRFEVVVFTAAIPVYAEPVLNLIDPKKRIKHRLFRSSTVTFEGQPYVKDLSLLGRDMSRIVLVDNNPAAMLACPDNAIPILSFYDSQTDRELESLLPLLIQLDQAKDVRPVLIDRFRFRAMIEEAKMLAATQD
ncbi:hypothetical protein AAMO2058_000313200 [Amorphochlora amoebiformis]